MTTHILEIDDVAVTRWRNGGGSTRELLVWPPDTPTFDWRVSVATITGAGPFSTFPGVTRTLTLLSGDGILLRGKALDQRIDRLYTPVVFDGDVELDCTPLSRRPCTALNVMSEDRHGEATVEIITGPWTTRSATHGMLLSLTGSWQVGSQQLPAGTARWWVNQPHLWRMQPDTSTDRIAVITWEPRRSPGGSEPSPTPSPL